MNIFDKKILLLLLQKSITSKKICWRNDIFWLAWEWWSHSDMELHDAEEAIRMRKISPNQKTKENTLWILTDSHGVMRVPKSNLHPRTKISSIGVTNPEIVYMLLLFQMLCIYWCCFLKKTLTLTENLLSFHGTYMDRKQPFERFWKWMLRVVSFLGVDVFLPIWILFALDFYCDIHSFSYGNRKF